MDKEELKDLALRAQSGDRSALETLAIRLAPLLSAMVRSVVRDPEVAEEVLLGEGFLLSRGWGFDGPVSLDFARQAIRGRLQVLAPTGDVPLYRRIVMEFGGRAEGFRARLKALTAEDPESAQLSARLASLTECQWAHEKRLAEMERAEAERKGLEERLRLLERILQWGETSRQGTFQKREKNRVVRGQLGSRRG